jgi:DNA-binding protein Alba
MEQKKENCVYIGGKPFMNYVMALGMQFRTNNAKEVIVKGRGKYTSRVIDVVECFKRQNEDIIIPENGIKIGSEVMDNKENRDKPINVSTIEIILRKS